MIVTIGGLLFWWLIDCIMILVGACKDSDGDPLVDWTLGRPV